VGRPRGTDLNGLWIPLTQSILALAENKPDIALDALRPAARWERRFGDVTLQRGLALMQGGDPAAAAADFRRLVDSPSPWPPGASVYASALVALARALAASNDAAGAVKAYEQFLDLWKHADSDLPIVAEAHQELASLRTGSR